MSEINDIQKVVFLNGKKVNLRPFSKADVPIITRWINDPGVRQFISSVFPQTEMQEEGWFSRLGSDNKNITLCIETKKGKPIGIMGIHKINWTHRHCETGALIGEKEYWGRGFGTDAKMHLLRYVFDTLNLNRVGSNVIAFNERSLNYSLRCVYREEGRKRQYIWRNGQYHDLIELGLLREDFEIAWEAFQKKSKSKIKSKKRKEGK